MINKRHVHLNVYIALFSLLVRGHCTFVCMHFKSLTPDASVESTGAFTDHQTITKRKRLGDRVAGLFFDRLDLGDTSWQRSTRTVLFSGLFLPLPTAGRHSTPVRLYSGHVSEGLF
jgi:hypothetical protein